MYSFKFDVKSDDDLDVITTKSRSLLLKKVLISKAENRNTIKELASVLLRLKGDAKPIKYDVYLNGPHTHKLVGIYNLMYNTSPFDVNSIFKYDKNHTVVDRTRYHNYLDCDFFLGVHNHRGYFLVDVNQIDDSIYAVIETIPQDVMTLQYNGRKDFDDIEELVSSRTITIYNIDTGESHSFFPNRKVGLGRHQELNTSIPMIKSRIKSYTLINETFDSITYDGDGCCDNRSVSFLYNILGGEFTEDYLSKTSKSCIIPNVLSSTGTFTQNSTLYDILYLTEGDFVESDNSILYDDLKRIGLEKYNDETLFIEKSMYYLSMMLIYSGITIFDNDVFNIHNYVSIYEKDECEDGYFITKWLNHPEFLNGPLYKLVEKDNDDSVYIIERSEVGEKILKAREENVENLDSPTIASRKELMFTSYKFLKEFIYPALFDKERIKEYLKRSYYVEN